MSEGWGLQQYEREYWKAAYWKTARSLCEMNNAYVRAKDLVKLNQQQAARIMELEMILGFFRRVGDGVIVIDHESLMNKVRFLENMKGLPPEFLPSLAASRYVRNT